MNPNQPDGGQQPPLQASPSPTPGPEQSYGPAPNQALPHHHPQYEFIMNPGSAGGNNGLGSLLSKRNAFIAGGVLLFILIIIVIGSSLSGSKADFTSVISVAEDQTELMRVAKLGTTDAVSNNAQDVAYNVDVSMTTAQQQTLAYLLANHTKVGTRQLSLKQSATTTTDLSTALANSTFDSTFLSHIQSLLTTYSQDLNTAFKADTGPKGRQLLESQYKAAQLLLTQTQQPQASD